MCEKMQVCLLCVQILLAVLAREYDWQVDLEEPLKTFPWALRQRGWSPELDALCYVHIDFTYVVFATPIGPFTASLSDVEANVINVA